MIFDASKYGDALCPLCVQPPPSQPWREQSTVHIEWSMYVPVSMQREHREDPLTAEGAASWDWTVTCPARHTLLTSHDLYDDDEAPPAPTFDDIQAWLSSERRLPIIRDHAYRDHNGSCYECEQPASRHAAQERAA